MKDTIYGLTITVGKPCGIIGCQCERGSRYIAMSYKPTKADIIKLEPGLERAVIERKVNREVVSVQAFKRLHAGINGRHVDGFSNWVHTLPAPVGWNYSKQCACHPLMDRCPLQ